MCLLNLLEITLTGGAGVSNSRGGGTIMAACLFIYTSVFEATINNQSAIS